MEGPVGCTHSGHLTTSSSGALIRASVGGCRVLLSIPLSCLPLPSLQATPPLPHHVPCKLQPPSPSKCLLWGECVRDTGENGENQHRLQWAHHSVQAVSKIATRERISVYFSSLPGMWRGPSRVSQDVRGVTFQSLLMRACPSASILCSPAFKRQSGGD